MARTCVLIVCGGEFAEHEVSLHPRSETPARVAGETLNSDQQVYLRKLAPDFMLEMNRSGMCQQL